MAVTAAKREQKMTTEYIMQRWCTGWIDEQECGSETELQTLVAENRQYDGGTTRRGISRTVIEEMLVGAMVRTRLPPTNEYEWRDVDTNL